MIYFQIMQRPSYTFNQMRILLQRLGSFDEMEAFRYILKDEKERYSKYEFNHLAELWVAKAARKNYL
jgi:hypothetical protein